MSTRSLLAGVWVGMLLGQFCPAVRADDRTDLIRWENPPVPPVATSPNAKTVSIPVEASVAVVRRHRAEYMNSTQIAAALKAGRDVAILPIGGVSARGPHVPLGSSLLVQHASAVLLAERWNAIAFPPIPFGASPRSQNSAGTISVPIEEQMAYVRAVVDSLLQGGFRRVVLLSEEEESSTTIALVTALYRDTRAVVFPVWMKLWPRGPEYDSPDAAGLQTLAAAKILGDSGLAGTYAFAQIRAEPVGRDTLQALRKFGIGAAPLDGPVKSEAAATKARVTEAEVDKAVEIMRQEARRYDNCPGVFAEYQADVRSQDADEPWSLENYARSVAKSYGDPPEKRPIMRTPPSPLDEQPLGPDIQPGFVAAKLDLPEEASATHIRKHRVEYLTGQEIQERLRDDPVVIVPIGAFEMHGPHCLLGTDIITAYAQSMIVAKPWNAIVLPPIYYTYSGATERWPGSVSVSQEHVVRYVKAVIGSLLDQGFRRIVIMGNHAPGEFTKRIVVREIQQERHRVIFTAVAMMTFSERMGLALGYASGEDNGVLACQKILGHPGVFSVDEPCDIGRIKPPFRIMGEFGKIGTRPAWNMNLPTEHVAVRECVRSGDEDKMIPVMREMAAEMAHAPEAMSRYLEEVEEARKAELLPTSASR